MSHDDIRQRLAAVEDFDWSEKREREREYYGDWLRFGPVLVPVGDPEDDTEAAEVRRAADFVQHAADDLRRLLADLDHTTTTRETLMPTHDNPVYGPPPDPDRGEPARYLADAIEVQRPNGDVVRMDLVALADAAINADRAVASLRKENEELRRKLATLEEKVSRIERAGRILAGGYEEV